MSWAQLWGDRAWIPTDPGFGLNPKSGLEKQRSRIIFYLADYLFIMQITLSTNSMDPDRKLCS